MDKYYLCLLFIYINVFVKRINWVKLVLRDEFIWYIVIFFIIIIVFIIYVKKRSRLRLMNFFKINCCNCFNKMNVKKII